MIKRLINKNKILFFISVILFFYLTPNTIAQTWKVGILAQRGEEYTYQHWQPWIDWLNQKFPQEKFLLLPIQLNTINDDIDLDLLLTNQSQFFYLNTKDLRWLATLVSPYHQNTSEVIGSAIFVKNESPYTRLKDLVNKKISAVDNNALGGFLLGYYELFKQGIRQEKDIMVTFTGFPVDNTLYLLKNGHVDAAIAPVCLFEEMVKEGKFNSHEFRILSEYPQQFNCLTSTELLPNWSLAVMPSIPDELATQISYELLQQKNDYLPKWTLPFTSSKTDLILRELYRHPQQKSLWDTVKDWIVLNKLSLFVIFGFILLNYLWISYQVHRKSQALKMAHIEMHQYQQQMTKADRLTLLGEMASGLSHEIKQPLSVIRMYSEGLKLDSNITSQKIILDKIIYQIDRCVEIIQNIRNWVKNKDHAEEAKIDLIKLINNVAEFIFISHKNKLKINIHSSKKYILEIKPTILEQIFANCFLNSIQANASKIEIDISDNNHILSIIINDNGIGFSEEQLSFPFVPFRSNKEYGLGLGLVICQRLINALQGNITLNNTEQGAQIILTLPMENNDDPSHC